MPKKRPMDDDEDSEIDAPGDSPEEDFTEEELADLYDLLGDFPELDEMDEILDYDEDDFYTENK